jgi:DNA-directed RNA polymerase subunit RPC12/RpoP
MDECSKCQAVYRVQASYGQITRNICRCETKRACGKSRKTGCKGPVVQALIDVDHEVEQYVCEEHSVLECLDVQAVSLKEDKRKQKNEIHIFVTPEEVKIMLQKDTYLTTCGDCGDQHPFSDRMVTEGYDVVCPKCSSKNIKEYSFDPPFEYRCPKCGEKYVVKTTAPTDKHPRCEECEVNLRMVL